LSTQKFKGFFFLESKFKVLLTFLNKIINKNPKENSKPARANKKNVVHNKRMSSLQPQRSTVKQYKIIQTNSE
jgi:hypothetical protein